MYTKTINSSSINHGLILMFHLWACPYRIVSIRWVSLGTVFSVSPSPGSTTPYVVSIVRKASWPSSTIKEGICIPRVFPWNAIHPSSPTSSASLAPPQTWLLSLHPSTRYQTKSNLNSLLLRRVTIIDAIPPLIALLRSQICSVSTV